MNGTVGIIGGGGWLGGAIAERGLSAGVLSASSLIVSGRSPRGDRYVQWPEVTWTSDNADLARRSEIVIVSVRPQQFGKVSLDLKGKLAISVMAGVSMATLRRRLNSDRVVRAMPNAAAEIGRSYTPWLACEHVTTADRAFVTALFSSCGEEDEVETERQLDFIDYRGTTAAGLSAMISAGLRDAVGSGLRAAATAAADMAAGNDV
ncbi:NAD(P)-binding domain-containing protein [Mesorhizobium sp. BAC0120]|uniref:pyrroline-5-carboxylate reductase family protein n=1 Tax=Mesorhizobium sp. BAC0120 TaxID=3090670 RepID=UPI00298D4541|nr:NAD(P)-binding domain-containing protein [Mesorhizobium sp. BAC0120]MDW6024220.1 NAD(P)-binding domain-containing protein [Mesorhizobium sp. BAC0120]